MIFRLTTIPLVLALGACSSTAPMTRTATTGYAEPAYAAPSVSGSTLAPTMLAATSSPSPTLARQEKEGQGGLPHPLEVTLMGTSYQESDFEDTNDELEVSRVAVHGTYIMPVESGVWRFRAVVEESSYETKVGGTFDDAFEIGAGATYYQPGPEWSWYATLNLNEGLGDGADFGDGTYFEGGGGVSYNVQDNLRIGLALVGRTQLEEDVEVAPFPIIEWEINDRSRIGFLQSSDPALGYTYELTDQYEWYIAVQRMQRQYRLDEDVLPDAAFVDEETGIRTGFVYRDGDAITVEAFVGAAQRTLLLDRDGEERGETDIETAPFFGITGSFSF